MSTLQPKSWQVGPKGGKYYVNGAGQKVYGAEAIKQARADAAYQAKSGARERGLRAMTQPRIAPEMVKLRQARQGAKDIRGKGAPAVAVPPSSKQVGRESKILPEFEALLVKHSNLTPRQHIEIAEKVLDEHNKPFPSTLKKLEDAVPDAVKVLGRVKKPVSAVEKIARNVGKPGGGYPDVSALPDLTGMMVVGRDAAHVKELIEKVRKAFPDIVKENDYNAEPQEDGYSAHHIITRLPGGVLGEIQIKTERQKEWADWSHEVYKPTMPEQRDWIKATGKKQELLDYGKKLADHFTKLDNKQPSTAPERPAFAADYPLPKGIHLPRSD